MQKDQKGDDKSNKGGGKKKESKKSEQNKDLGQYFQSMDKKLNL